MFSGGDERKIDALIRNQEETNLLLRELVSKLGSQPTTPPPDQPRALKPAEVAKLLSCSLSKVRALIASGHIQHVRIGKVPLVPMSEIIRLTTVSIKPDAPPLLLRKARERRTAIPVARPRTKAQLQADQDELEAALRKL